VCRLVLFPRPAVINVRYRTDCNGHRDQTAGIDVVMNIDIGWGELSPL
jgi:hypothetical protein